jgi:hypothetical protein
LTIPFTKMRQRYRDLQGLNTDEQLTMALAAKASDLAADFRESVGAFNEYSNQEPFFETTRKPLKALQDIEEIKRTEHFAAVLKAQGYARVEANPHLGFKYAERELVPARTTGGAKYANGDSATHLIRFDLLLVGELPILSELKLQGDNGSAFYALIQLLASASEMAAAPQRTRLWKYYSDHLPKQRAARFDLYLMFYQFNIRSKPKVAILNRTDQLAAELLTYPEVAANVRRIVALDSDWPKRTELTFKKVFSHCA